MKIENEDFYKTVLYHKSFDGTITKVIKIKKGTGTTWKELLVDYVDTLKSIGYSIPLTYDDIINM
mgnify:CR=1 FL=1